MTTLSTHVLDVERGSPAAGVPVRLYHAERPLAVSVTSADGRIADLGPGGLDSGTYRLEFDVAAYFASQDRPAPFLQRVSIEFRLDGADSHYHIPLLLAPFACTSYRGS